ncbi:MAG TPA: hypothetical protein VJG30_03990 [Candidatus Nanoarchaeia archaeon]|nr:hypothetical protein [Candidatus Nanoarchaeia archaeon]
MKKLIPFILLILILNVAYAKEDFESLTDGTANVKDLLDKYSTLKAPETAANAYSYNTLERASLDPDVRAQALYNNALGFKQIAELRREFQALPVDEIKKEAKTEKLQKKSLCAEVTATYGKPFSCQKLSPGQKPDPSNCITGRSCNGEYCCGEGDLYCCAEGFGESIEVTEEQETKESVTNLVNNIIIEIEDGNLREPNLQFMFDGSWKWRTKNKKEFNDLDISNDGLSSEWFKSIIINLRKNRFSFEEGIKIMIEQVNNKKPNFVEGEISSKLILLSQDPENEKLQTFEAYPSGKKQKIIYNTVISRVYERSQAIEKEKKQEVQEREEQKKELSQTLIEIEDGNPSVTNLQFIFSDEWKWKRAKDKKFLSAKTKEINAPFFSFEFDFTPDNWFKNVLNRLEKENTIEGGLSVIVEEVNKKEPFLPREGGVFIEPNFPKIIIMKGAQRKVFQVQKSKAIDYNEIAFSVKYATQSSISTAQ